MRAFSQLLDDLVYTRSRNTKLKLIGDYLKETPDPDRGYGLAALTGTLDIPAVKPARGPRHRRGAGRSGAALHEPRLCRRHGRDGRAAVAEARPASRPKSTTRPSASATRSSGCARRRGWMRRARWPRCSTISTRRAASRCSSWRPARFGSGSARGSPSRRWPTPSASRSRRSRRSGTALRPPFTELFDWAEGRGEQPTAARRAGVPPVHARPPARRHQGLARRLCRRVEMGRDPRPARPRRRRDPALQPHRRRHLGQLPRRRRGVPDARPCSTASCWSAGRTRASPTSTAARRRASTRSSSGSGARTSARRCSAPIPAFVRLYDILFDGDEDLRELPWERAADAARSLRRRARSRTLRRLAADRRGRASRSSRTFALNARDVVDRGHHAQAPRQPLCRRPPRRPVVQMEARSADRRLRADVRPARLRQALELLQRLHLRLLDRGRASCCRSARPISASPTRS